MALILKPRAALRRLHTLSRYHGGIWTALRKAIRAFRTNGIAGLRKGFRSPASRDLPPGRNRPDDDDDLAIEIPFNYSPDIKPQRLCAIIHVFYPDLCAEIIRYLENVPGRIDVFVSTTSDTKRREIENHFMPFTKGELEVRVFENRGRDIAPKLVGFRDVYDRYDIALSLHTKKSPHGGSPLENWRHYLYEHLIGSPRIVASNLALLQSGAVGMVFPQHLFYLRPIFAWGVNYHRCRDLLARAGVEIHEGIYLECPTGSMFWCRTDALRKLLELDLQFLDFDDEEGQTDGTLAHAMERAFLYAVEAQGYTWAKVSRRDLYPLPHTLLPINRFDDIAPSLQLVHRPLLQPAMPLH